MVPSLLCLFVTSALTPLATSERTSLKFLSRSAAPVTSTIRRESAEQKAAQEQAVDGGDNSARSTGLTALADVRKTGHPACRSLATSSTH